MEIAIVHQLHGAVCIIACVCYWSYRFHVLQSMMTVNLLQCPLWRTQRNSMALARLEVGSLVSVARLVSFSHHITLCFGSIHFSSVQGPEERYKRRPCVHKDWPTGWWMSSHDITQVYVSPHSGMSEQSKNHLKTLFHSKMDQFLTTLWHGRWFSLSHTHTGLLL